MVGVTLDIVSILQASNRLERATEAVSGWAGAWAGCRVMGQGGAYLGTAIEPGLGAAVGALGGCIIGGAAGYYAASGGAGIVYDWGEETFFSPLPEAPAPRGSKKRCARNERAIMRSCSATTRRRRTGSSDRYLRSTVSSFS